MRFSFRGSLYLRLFCIIDDRYEVRLYDIMPGFIAGDAGEGLKCVTFGINY